MQMNNPIGGINNRSGQALQILITIHNQKQTMPHIMPTSGTIARDMDCSISYVEQGLRLLRNGGHVFAVRGPGGGYELVAPLEEIDVLSIIELANQQCTINPVLAGLFQQVNVYDLAAAV
jgi:DNA-binding IscR family transcriptional regulator